VNSSSTRLICLFCAGSSRRLQNRSPPIGGQRRVTINSICDCLVELLANVLVVVGPPEDLDELTSLFRDKLEEAVRATPGEPCSPLN
jgi:hypothetical protein